MLNSHLWEKIISIALIVSLLVSTTAWASTSENTGLSDPNPQILMENIEEEHIITETILNEFITEEVYLEEIVVAEDKITELLLEEETIDEVILCKTIYVPQENIADFSVHSQTSRLFGDDIDISSLLTKITVGTGVIVTVVVLKKSGLPKPIASAVVAAADESLKFAERGVAIGTLFGGLTGATDELDQSGRLSAVTAFAVATAGLIIAIVSLVGAVPSGGSTSITAAAGIKLVIAGIGALLATAEAAETGYQVVKTFTSTDAVDIDWQNIDWNSVGVASAEKAINYGADGYMWGAIIGTVYGGAEGYDFYQKYNTPYSKYNARLMQTPKEGNGGHWSGDRGESEFILDEPIVCSDGREIKSVLYQNAVPDFAPFQKVQVKIPKMTNSRPKNFRQADQALAEYWTRIKYQGRIWTVNNEVNEIEIYRRAHNLTWHEMNNMESMQLVPSEVNSTFGHLGGVGEFNAMIGQEGVSEFD